MVLRNTTRMEQRIVLSTFVVMFDLEEDIWNELSEIVDIIVEASNNPPFALTNNSATTRIYQLGKFTR